MTKEDLEQVIHSYKDSPNALQKLFYDKIVNREIHVGLSTRDHPFANGNKVFIDPQNYASPLVLKVALSHECAHTFQHQEPFNSFRNAISEESEFFLDLLKENHAYTIEQISSTYNEIKQLVALDAPCSRETNLFYKILEHEKEYIDANPKALLKKCIQTFFLSQFNYSDQHLNLYLERVYEKDLKKESYDDIEANIRVATKMLGESIPITLSSFPFPDDADIQQALKKEDMTAAIDVFDDVFLDKCVSQLKELRVFNHEDKEVSVFEALKNLKEHIGTKSNAEGRDDR